MHPDLPWLQEELAAQSDWVRRLARSLVHDETAAEDLVQDTWVAALRTPPDDRRALRGWLARVVRTLAWKRQRRDASAPVALEASELPSSGTNESELVERLELHRLLADELHALREPLRTTLLQRYFEGLSAAEIARKSGVPAPTVRYRLQQGLEELRTRLDARFGGRRDTWMSALAFALPSKGVLLGGTGKVLASKSALPGGSGLAIGEGVLMSTLVKVSLGAAALVAVVLVLRYVTRDEVPPGPALAQTPQSKLARPEGEPAAAGLTAQDAADPARAAVAETKPDPALAPPPSTFVVARFLDEQHRGIAKAWLRHVNTRRQLVLVDSETLALSGADGVLRVPRTEEDPLSGVRLAAGADGFTIVFPYCEKKEGVTLDLGDIVLHPGGSVRGFVVDPEHQPIAHAVVQAGDEPNPGDQNIDLLRNRGPQRGGLVHACESAADGSFLLEGVPVGTTRLWAKSGDLRWAVSAPISIAAGASNAEIVLVVEPGGSSDPELADVEGRVLDPAGQPVPYPHIDARHKVHNSSSNELLVGDADGRFRIHPMERGAEIGLHVEDAEGRFQGADLEGIRPGTTDLVVRLGESRTLVLAVSDEHGAVERFRVFAGDEHSPQGRAIDPDEPHSEGRVTVRVPSESFWYHVEAPGHAAGKVGPIDGRNAPATLGFQLVSVPCVRGRVMDGDRAVAGAKLSLCEQRASATSVTDGFRSYVSTFRAVTTTSEPDGSFSLGIPGNGNYSVFADAEGFARAQYGPVELSTEQPSAEIVFALDAGGALEGRVLMPAGRSPAGVVVGINRGDGKPIKRTVGADGVFRFELLTPGPWEIVRAADPITGYSATMVGGGRPDAPPIRLREDFTIELGKTTHKDLDLSVSTASALDVELLSNSAPARGWSVQLRPKGNGIIPGSLPRTTTDGSGHAHLEAQFEGECTLWITPPAESASGLHLQLGVTLQRGANTWSRNIETGRIEGTIADWKMDSGLEWTAASGSEAFPIELHPDSSGHFVEPFVPAGSVAIRRAKADTFGIEPEMMQSFEIAPGETKTLQLP